MRLQNSTGLNYWIITAIISANCAAYTSIGGFTAVVWTDVIQMFTILVSTLAIAIKGTIHVGGVTEVWNLNSEGNRTVLFRFSPDNETNYTVWSLVFGGFFLGLSQCISQSGLQRQVSNKHLKGAQITMLLVRGTSSLLYMLLSWIGMVTFANYHSCDPVLNKEIRSQDQITPLFVKKIFESTNGFVGLFFAGILAALLSTFSTFTNEFSAIIIVDFIKPFFPSAPDKTMTKLSKIIGCAYCGLIVALTLVVEKIGNLTQVVYVCMGIAFGPISGMFIIGLFFPWATTMGASVGCICSCGVMWWMVFGRMVNPGPTFTLPITTEGCSVLDLVNQTISNAVLNITVALNGTLKANTSQLVTSLKNESASLAPLVNSAVDSGFALYRVNPLLYTMIGLILCITIGLVVSLIFGERDPETVDPRYISPIVWSILNRLPVRWRKWMGFRSDKFLGNISMVIFLKDMATSYPEKEMANLQQSPEAEKLDSGE